MNRKVQNCGFCGWLTQNLHSTVILLRTDVWFRARKTQRKRDICTFDYSVRFMNNHAGLTLTRPTGTMFSHINAR